MLLNIGFRCKYRLYGARRDLFIINPAIHVVLLESFPASNTSLMAL